MFHTIVSNYYEEERQSLINYNNSNQNSDQTTNSTFFVTGIAFHFHVIFDGYLTFILGMQ